jgi:hypothetical protein
MTARAALDAYGWDVRPRKSGIKSEILYLNHWVKALFAKKTVIPADPQQGKFAALSGTQVPIPSKR